MEPQVVDVWAFGACEVQLLVQLYALRLFVRLCLSDPGYCQAGESGVDDACPRVMRPWAC